MPTATSSKNARRSAEEERRRSKRLPLNIPVRVYGRTPQNLPFRHVSVTSEVSAHGGQLPLDANIQHGQTLLLVNSYTGEERECMVVYVDEKKSKKKKIGVQFTHVEGDFWHVFMPVGGPRLD
ncbi:MAG: PilZ domain-containing protein [Candidatus Acidiferrales bacterium]